MFNDNDKKIAKRIVDDPAIVELIAKVFLETEDKIDSEFIKSKTNSELGEIVRANLLAEEKVHLRWARLKNLANSPDKKSKTVPK